MHNNKSLVETRRWKIQLQPNEIGRDVFADMVDFLLEGRANLDPSKIPANP